MGRVSGPYSLSEHFEGKDPAVRKLYEGIISVLEKLGPIQEEPKKTSIHLVNVSALAGVEVRKDYLLLNLKSNHEIKSRRIVRTEQVSARRFHHKVKVSSLSDLDDDLQNWLKEAFELSC